MKTDVLKRAVKAPAGKRSLEVRHARRGFGIAMRRGLHGAKNWVFEPDEDGLPRTAGIKALRVFVVLVPVWLVASAATGGPERGGQEASVPKTVFIALLLTLAGLGWFSARERRLGREEPWLDLPDLDPESDDSEEKTKVDPSPEAPTEVIESPQVSEVDSAEAPVTPGDISDESDQKPQDSSEVVTEAVTETPSAPPSGGVGDRPFDQVTGAVESEVTTPLKVVTEAVTLDLEIMTEQDVPDALEEDTPTVILAGGHPTLTTVPVSLDKVVTSQVSGGDRLDVGSSRELPYRGNVGTTESDISPGSVTLERVVTGLVTNTLQEGLFPQVGDGDQVVTPVVTQFVPATPGPYPTEGDPVSDDWWFVKPDVVTGDDPEDQDEGPAEELEGGEEEQEEPVVALSELQSHHPAVLLYLAVRGMPDATEKDKEAAREGAVEWVRTEIAEGRQSQRSAASLLGVSKTTIANWTGRDPFSADGLTQAI